VMAMTRSTAGYEKTVEVGVRIRCRGNFPGGVNSVRRMAVMARRVAIFLTGGRESCSLHSKNKVWRRRVKSRWTCSITLSSRSCDASREADT
jgi:hypothetical protein